MKEELDLFLVTGTAFTSMIALHFNSLKSPMTQFIFWVVPQYLVIIYPNYSYTLNMTLGVLSIVFYMINKRIKQNIKDKTNQRRNVKYRHRSNGVHQLEMMENNDLANKENINVQPRLKDIEDFTIKDLPKPKLRSTVLKTASLGTYYPVLDSYRAYLLSMVLISILACDFNFFPDNFHKTEFYGYSLMDIGIGAFLFNNGALAYKLKPYKLLKTTLSLFLLGFIRLLVITTLKYPVNITEYGKHLNFYFVLGFTNIAFYCINTKYNFKVGLIITLLYEYFLVVHKYDIYIFQEIRNTLFLQNKEGIFQIIPSLCIFLFSSVIGKLTELRNERDKLKGLIKYTIIFFIGFLISQIYSPPSRRLGNTTYVMWIMTLHSMHLTLAFIVSHFTGFNTIETHEFVSKNMMTIFIWANLLVLIVNISIKCAEWKIGGHCIMMAYLFLVIMIPYYLNKHLSLYNSKKNKQKKIQSKL